MAHARQDVEERTVGRRGEPDTVGRNHRNAKGPGQRVQRDVVDFLIAQQMPLQLDVDAAPAEQADQAIEQAADAVSLPVEQRAAAEGDQAGGAAVELLEHQRALPFRPTALRGGTGRRRASSCA